MSAILNGKISKGRLYGPTGVLLPERSAVATGYSNYGANQTKTSMAGWISQGGSPDEDIIQNLQILRERSRDCWMGIPLGAGAIETLVTNVIGPGLEHNPNVDGDALGLTEEETGDLNLELRDKFSWWSDNPRECDFDAKLTFSGLQSLAFQTELLSGDTPVLFHLKTRRHTLFDFRVRVLESDRVCEPWDRDETLNSFGGVELSDDGEVAAYWVAQSHPLSRRAYWSGYAGDSIRVPAFGEETGRRNMLLMMRPERPEQRRGVPILAVALETLKQGGRHFESTTVAAILQSYFTAWITTEMPSLEMFNELLTPAQKADLQWLQPYGVALGPGIINQLKPGQGVQFGNPSQPTPTFSDFQITLAKWVGAALGIPFELLLKQFQASYSASRAALLEFWKRVRKHRQHVVESFCQPVYEEWLEDAISLGRIEGFADFDDPYVRRALCRCNWMGTSPTSLDPYKEALASQLKINLMTSTIEREASETNGSSWYENVLQQGRERDLTDEEGLIYPGLRAAPYK